MSKTKAYIYFICFVILFQDSIFKITNISFINYIDEMIVVGLALVAFFNIVTTKKINRISLKLLYLISIFSFIGIISNYLNSTVDLKKIIMSNFLTIKFFIIIFSLMNIKMTDVVIKNIKESLLFFSKIVMIFALFNFIAPEIYKKIFPFIALTYRMGIPCVTSLFWHTGTYGWFMLLIALYHYSVFLQTNDKIELRWSIICIFFAILSFRVKVIVGIAVTIIFGIFIRYRKKMSIKKISIVLIAVVILILFSDMLKYNYFLYFTDSMGETARQSLTINSINIARDYFPIGVGFGKYGSWYAKINYSEFYYKYNMTFVHGMNPNNPVFATDTYWPSIIGETGVIGTIIWIMILVLIFNRIKNNYKLGSNTETKVMALWGMLVFIQAIIESTSEQIFNNSPQYILISILLVIGLSKKNPNSGRG